MNEETQAFLDDFRSLLQKHNVSINKDEQYGNGETYLGAEYIFDGGDLNGNGHTKINIGIEDIYNLV